VKICQTCGVETVSVTAWLGVALVVVALIQATPIRTDQLFSWREGKESKDGKALILLDGFALYEVGAEDLLFGLIIFLLFPGLGLVCLERC